MSSSKKPTSSRMEEKKVLQAVVICDSFNNRFLPLTETKPRVLLPLINVPILHYCLYSLKISKIQEVFVFCSSHAQQIREYINDKWSSNSRSFQVTVFASDSYMSYGDVLRDLDAKALIRHDFVLMNGDTIMNLSLKDHLDEHRALVKVDKGCVMTMIYIRSNPGHRTRTLDNESVLIINNNTNKLLLFEKMNSTQKKVDVNLGLFQENKNVRVRFDLLDTQIAICSASVPQLFSDNFDYDSRDHLVSGILEHEQIMGNSIYIKVCDSDSYAARVSCPSAYDAISKDVLQRWSYPIVPELLSDYGCRRHNIYKGINVLLTAETELDSNVAIGEQTIIGSNTYIKDSVIGSGCRIGNNVSVIGSYLWDNVVIEDDCRLNSCIIGDGTVLKNRSYIGHGCLISGDVFIGPNVQLKRCTFISNEPADEEDVIDKSLVGDEGKGYLFTEDEDAQATDLWGDEDEGNTGDMLSTSESGLEDEDDFGTLDDHVDDFRLFFNEVLDSFQRGVEEKVKCENLILEVNSSKHAYNIPIKEVTSLVMKATLEMPNTMTSSKSDSEYHRNLQTVLKHLLPLLQNYIRNRESQYDCLVSIEEFGLAYDTQFTSSILVNLISFLYDKDILDEHTILDWFRNPKPLPVLISDTEFNINEQEALRKQKSVETFMKWLEEAEEESD